MIVSVIVPVFNGEKYLSKCIESIITLPEVLEILIVDDGSTDQSLKLAHQLSVKHNKIKVLTHENNLNLGSSSSKNLGIKHAVGEIISFLDVDDLYLPNRFTFSVSHLLSRPDVDGVYESLGTFYENEAAKVKYYQQNKTEITGIKNEKIPSKQLFETIILKNVGWVQVNCWTLKRKSLLEKNILFDPTLRQADDTDFMYQLSLNLNLISGSSTNPVALRRIHDTNRIINSLKERDNDRLYLFKKWFNKIVIHGNYKSSINIYFTKHYISEITKSKYLNFSRSKLYFELILLLIKHPKAILKLISL